MSIAASGPSPLPTVTPTGTETVAAVVVKQPVSGADGIKEAVSAKSGAAGDIVDTLDSLALQVGHTRISLWDVSVVASVLVFAVLAAWFLSKLSTRTLSRMTRLDVTQRLLAEKMASLVIWATCLLVGIDVLGIDLTALAVFSGAFGLAIGFGLQKTFGNLIAGIILLMDKSIKPGDVIAITDQGGKSTFGQIRRIGIRAVSLTTRDQKEYLIPNENLMVNQVENWSYSSKNVRIQVPVGIAYQSDIVRAEELMLEAARSVGRVLAAPPPTVWLDTYGESWLGFHVNVWINDPEEGVGNVRSDVLKALWHLFKANGIVVPFPQRDLTLKDSAAFRELLAALRDESDDKGGKHQ